MSEAQKRSDPERSSLTGLVCSYERAPGRQSCAESHRDIKNDVCKRRRSAGTTALAVCSACTQQPAPEQDDTQGLYQTCMLFQVPGEVLELVLSFLDAPTLAILACTCKPFQTKDRSNRLSLVHKVAREQLVKCHGPDLAARWRHCSWLERLQIEEAATGFDHRRCEQQGFVFSMDPLQCHLTAVKLEGIGPKMLLSDVTTADVPLLRWRLELKGNNAVEFGTIPVSLQDQPKALHKCYNDSDGARPSGFCSAITVGSMLPVKLPLMRGSIVEILARKDRLAFIVTNPPNGMEMTWQNTVTIPKPYKGPLEFRFEQDLHPDQPVKLAVTCWARAAFEVLHTHMHTQQQPSSVDLVSGTSTSDANELGQEYL